MTQMGKSIISIIIIVITIIIIIIIFITIIIIIPYSYTASHHCIPILVPRYSYDSYDIPTFFLQDSPHGFSPGIFQ